MVEHTDRDPDMVPPTDEEIMEKMEQRMQQLEDEIKALKERVSQLEQ